MNRTQLTLFDCIAVASIGMLLGCADQSQGSKEYTAAAAESNGAHSHDGQEHHHHHDHGHHHPYPHADHPHGPRSMRADGGGDG